MTEILRVPRVIAHALLGSATTFVVAWCCAAAAQHRYWTKLGLDQPGMRFGGGDGKDWPEPPPANWPKPNGWYEQDDLGSSIRSWFHNPYVGPQSTGPSYCMWETSSGWPMAAVTASGAELVVAPPLPVYASSVPWWRRGVIIPIDHVWFGRVGVKLAIVPQFPGFAANTAVYAALWWTMFFSISSTRRLLRRRRGLCPRCAYDRTGLAPNSPCPECGHTNS